MCQGRVAFFIMLLLILVIHRGLIICLLSHTARDSECTILIYLLVLCPHYTLGCGSSVTRLTITNLTCSHAEAKGVAMPMRRTLAEPRTSRSMISPTLKSARFNKEGSQQGNEGCWCPLRVELTGPHGLA